MTGQADSAERPHLFDVIEVQIANPHTERVMATRLTEADADWFVKFAIARRGVDRQFYVTRPSRGGWR